MSVVFHIATRAEWGLALAAGVYRTGSLDAEGFIHCSTAEQVAETANRLFAGRTDLVLLFIDGERLAAALRYEPVTDPPGEVFRTCSGRSTWPPCSRSPRSSPARTAASISTARPR